MFQDTIATVTGAGWTRVGPVGAELAASMRDEVTNLRRRMPTVIVTGSGGLIGSESVRYFVAAGFEVIGLDNDMRARFFGPEASTRPVTEALAEAHPEFHAHSIDIRDAESVDRVFATHGKQLELVIHTAAQPSHDWAARDPHTDFTVNANGTLNLLESTRRHAPNATFIFTSTNKVYGDRPNFLPLIETETRLELPEDHHWYGGIDTTMPLDRCTHSLFGVSKAAADLMVQEYGRYFDMPTVCFRGGCLTGPKHAGAQLHGFLAFLMRCTVTGEPYTVIGYDGKQVRDNIHAADVASAFAAFHAAPRAAAVYNLGGGRFANCSMREAIAACERISGRTLHWTLADAPRIGDHRWWISDLDEFRTDYPDWTPVYDLETTLREIHDRNVERWLAEARADAASAV